MKADDLLTKAEIQANLAIVSKALYIELKTRLDNECSKMQDISKARNAKITVCLQAKNHQERNGRMSARHAIAPGPPGPMDLEAFDVATFSGTARRFSQRLFASAAARKKQRVMALLDIDKAFRKGLTYSELAAATGEQERMACFTLPPGSAAVLRSLPGFEFYDESEHCSPRLKPGKGAKMHPEHSRLSSGPRREASGSRPRRAMKCLRRALTPRQRSMSVTSTWPVRVTLLPTTHTFGACK